MNFWILQTVLNASRCAALVRSERKEARSKKRVAGWVSCSCLLLPRVEYRLGTTLLILGNGKNSADFTRRKKALFFRRDGGPVVFRVRSFAFCVERCFGRLRSCSCSRERTQSSFLKGSLKKTWRKPLLQTTTICSKAFTKIHQNYKPTFSKLKDVMSQCRRRG